MSDPMIQTPPPFTTSRAPAAQPRKRRRWPRVVIALLGLLLLLIWFAPTIVARTVLRNALARQVGASLDGTLTIGGASLGWLAPIELREIQLTDPQGRVVAQIPRVTSSKSLIGLIRDRGELGTFTITQPTVDIVCTEQSTNLEEVLRKLLESESTPDTTRPAVALKITDGTVTLRDDRTGQVGNFHAIEADVTVPAVRTEAITVRLTMNAPQPVEVDVVAGSTGQVKLRTQGLAVESLAPLLRRFDPEMTLAAVLTTDTVVTWSPDHAVIAGTLSAQNLMLTAPWLNGDTLRLASVELPLKATLTGSTVQIEQAQLQSDVGKLTLSGVFDANESLERLFERPDVKLDAKLDLAKLAATLPRLLHIREGTTLEHGTITASVASRATPNGTAWAGNITTSALKAKRSGRTIDWDDPLTVEFVGRVLPGEFPTFEKLICRAEFMSLNAVVTPQEIRAAANLQLDKLAERLADFVDLGGVSLEGEGTAWFVGKREHSGEFKADGGLELKQFAFSNAEGRGLRERALKLQLASTGTVAENGPITITTATLACTAAEDSLHLKLLDPIPDLRELSGGKVDARLGGDLTRWRARVGAAVAIPANYVIAGNATSHGVIRFHSDLIAVDGFTLGITNARFRGAGLDVDEQTMNAVTDLRIERKTGTTTFDKFTINSAPLSVDKGQLIIRAKQGTPVVVEGGGPAVVGLTRLGKTLKLYTDPRGPDAMHGKGTGPLHFRTSEGVTTFKCSLDIANFALGVKTAPDWEEAALRLEMDGSYTEPTQSLAFRAAKVERPGLAVDAAGSWNNMRSTSDVNLSGNLAYDLAKLSPKLKELLGGNFTATGRGSKPFAIAGSLSPESSPKAKQPPGPFANLTATASVGWDSLNAYGFDVGQGELNAKLAKGVARVNRVTATFGGGEVIVHPTFRLDPPPSEVTLYKGMIIDRARLTPEVCASALGYALPTIANSGKAAGEVSLVLDENKFLITDIRNSQAQGKLLIHKATVTAGPIMTELAKLVGADSSTVTLASDSTVPVRFEKGRVYHENFSVTVGRFTITTSGSVGIDGSLDLIADLPLPAELPALRNTPIIAKALAGKRVQIPLKGMLGAPKIDVREFQAAIARLARDATKDAGRDLLNRELEKLFQGMPAPDGPPRKGGLLPFPILPLKKK